MEDKKKGEIVEVICMRCKNLNRHKILASFDRTGEEDLSGEWFNWSDSHQIVQCQGCGDLAFRLIYSDSDQRDPETGEFYETVDIHPKRSSYTRTEKSYMTLPRNLHIIYREVISCFNENNSILMGAGLRAIVEGICRINKIEGGNVTKTPKNGEKILVRRTNLEGKINGLHENGILTNVNANVLHELRFLGNSSIHELSQPTREELKLGLDIIESILNALYELPSKGNEIKLHRELNDSDESSSLNYL